MWLPVWRRAGASDEGADAMACVVLAPWTGRLIGGRIEFAGRRWNLSEGAGGIVKDGAWRVLDRGPRSVRLEHEVEPGQAGWPWGFVARVRYELVGDRLSAGLEVTSRSSSPMPLGMGFGPAWNRRVLGDDDRVGLSVATVSRGRIEIGLQGSMIDECFVSADGAGEIRWEPGGLRAGWTCTPELSHVSVRTPRGAGSQPVATSFEVHPVSMSPGGFEMLARAQARGGVAVLQSGETMRGAWSVRVWRE